MACCGCLLQLVERPALFPIIVLAQLLRHLVTIRAYPRVLLVVGVVERARVLHPITAAFAFVLASAVGCSPTPPPSPPPCSSARSSTPTTTTTPTVSHEEWVSWRRRPPGRGTPRWHNRQRLRGARHRLQIVCTHRRHCRCCRRLRRRHRGALRLSRRSRGREAHVAAHQPRLPLESELRRRPRRGHRRRAAGRSRAAEATRSGDASVRRRSYTSRGLSTTLEQFDATTPGLSSGDLRRVGGSGGRRGCAAMATTRQSRRWQLPRSATTSGARSAAASSGGGRRSTQVGGYAPETRPTSHQHQLQTPKQAAPALCAPTAPAGSIHKPS